MLRSVALKRRNFSKNLDFKGKIVAKFLLRSHFLLICNNMAVKQHIKHRALQKVFYLRNSIFHSMNLCFTLSLLLYPRVCIDISTCNIPTNL